VVKTKLVKDCGEKARAGHFRFNGLVAELVGAAVYVARLETTARQKQAKRVAIMITAGAALSDR